MTQDPISLAAERAADLLRQHMRSRNYYNTSVAPGAITKDLLGYIEALDAARVLLQAYETAEQEIRDQVAGTAHEQHGRGPAYLMAVFESMRVGNVKAEMQRQKDQP